VKAAQRSAEVPDWGAVGTANMVFHAAIVELADSQRLNTFYGHLSAELRLVFGLLNDAEFLHAPYIDMNAAILEHLEAGRPQDAAKALDAYLVQSERTILAAYARRGS
jgi:DNA-binding GntR family transcriptional regulator